MNAAQAIGKRVKELLNKKGLTQYKLAKATCLSQNCLSSLLNGKTKDVKFTSIYLIAQYLNISLEEFFNSPLFNEENIDI